MSLATAYFFIMFIASSAYCVKTGDEAFFIVAMLFSVSFVSSISK